MKGPGQHCDMLRRQYKYLISLNGNRHGALIAPHIIWGAVSAADIPFDPSSVSPLSSSFGPSRPSFVYAVYFRSYVIICPSAPMPSCFYSPLSLLSSSSRWRLRLLSSPLTGHVCLLCFVLSSGSLFAVVSHYDLGWGKIAARGHIGTQIDAHMGPRDNVRHRTPQAHLFCMYCMCHRH